jgi:class 3 adenylate cyclase
MPALPGGTVTFVFTDIEGSTKLLQELGDAGYAQASGDHRRIVREAFGARGGSEVDTQGDAFFFSFPRARDAAAAAVDAQRMLRDHAWPNGSTLRVRMGLHTGEPQVGEEGYLGLDVVRAARIAAAGHGGQILLSETTRALLGNQLPDGTGVRDLGRADLKDIQHEHVFELAVDGAAVYAPLKTQPTQSMGERLAERIQARIEQEVDRRLAAGDDLNVVVNGSTKLAAGGLLTLVMVAATVVVIVLLVRLAL